MYWNTEYPLTERDFRCSTVPAGLKSTLDAAHNQGHHQRGSSYLAKMKHEEFKNKNDIFTDVNHPLTYVHDPVAAVTEALADSS